MDFISALIPLPPSNTTPIETLLNAKDIKDWIFIPKSKQAALGVKGIKKTGLDEAKLRTDQNGDPCKGKHKTFFLY